MSIATVGLDKPNRNTNLNRKANVLSNPTAVIVNFEPVVAVFTIVIGLLIVHTLPQEHSHIKMFVFVTKCNAEIYSAVKIAVCQLMSTYLCINTISDPHGVTLQTGVVM